mmetsp:Transcript_67191/g.108219  ORF Transcript_67191/g.108219 Transcript_67191/m.108219 type:complete len:406 (-) Transcript_67191:286-1503(-)
MMMHSTCIWACLAILASLPALAISAQQIMKPASASDEVLRSAEVLQGALWTDSGNCEVDEEVPRNSQCLLQKKAESLDTASRKVLGGQRVEVGVGSGNSKLAFIPTQGKAGMLSAALVDEVCSEDFYSPSQLETDFHEHAIAWTQDKIGLCSHLGQSAKQWLDQNKAGILTGETTSVFSRLCKKDYPVQLLEPLAGILRDPRFICNDTSEFMLYSIEWLLLADGEVRRAGSVPSKHLFFDAGGSHFSDALSFFTSTYQQRGIVFDRIYAWEAKNQTYENYWIDVPAEVRQFWEPRVTFYNGVPVTAETGDQNNPVERVYELCSPDDFCAFKLDIDTPLVELALAQQLLHSPHKTAASLDELFFEHHVEGLMEDYGWKYSTNGTYLDSYNLFSALRHIGVRAHSWI